MKKLFDFLADNKISPNGLYVLHSTYNGYRHLNYVNIITEQYRLELSGYLEKAQDNSYKITNKGLMLLKDSEKHVKAIKDVNKKGSFKEWEDNIIAFNEIFPKGRRPGTSLGYRTPPKELFSRFAWFFDEYPEYNWDMVLDATKKYVNKFDEENDYTFLQTAKYFIKKDDRNKSTSSTLASICYMINEGENFEIDTGHHYFGP